MSDALRISPEVTARQIAASNPAVSAWVSANAGSGKTHVLTQRVIRLLLDGVDPPKILCLTFTKAAAANMATRVFDTLARWTALDDAGLDQAIKDIEGRPPDAHRRLRARRLFAEALETPGGLKVQTIHAFCTALLHQFPFEADVAARFEVMEERAAAELIDRLRLDVLQEAADKRDSPLGRALTAAIVAAADVTFADVVREAIAEGDTLVAWVDRVGSVEAAIADLALALGISPDDTLERVEADFFASPHFPVADWPAAMAACATGLANDQAQIARLRKVQTETGTARINAYLEIFCTTTSLEPRQNVITQGVRSAHPDLAARLGLEQTRVCALLQRLRAVRLRDRTAALVTIAYAVLSRYRAEKERAGLLDYDDLIDKTLTLLSRDGSAAWVMYKLDLGIDHVLIDEAQDTSPKQWDVIRLLTAEFFAGAGARSVKRSIFAVGDEKQSIFSFQGAAPHRFEEMRRHFKRAHEAGGLDFSPVRFQHSFRSGPDILGAVDEVFGRREAFTGLTADPVKTAHEAVRATAPGCVEIWPLEVPDERPAIEAWDAPFDTTTEQHPRARLARRIAATVRRWIEGGALAAATGKSITPGDVLVLVRQRGPLFEAIIRALKDAGVEVAGADRLVLNEHIAVMDLMSLADALLLPEDDLALAEVLKSPLFGLDDASLFALAHERRSTLRATLRAKAAENPRFADAAAMLDQLAVKARQETPFAFYAGLLGKRGGRRKMLARLGFEAADALDEFLALALDYERRHTPSLQGFVAWLRATPPEVKRDMDIVRDEVRVMTVHGAKGLEAPVVILADTTTKPEGPRDPALLTLAAPPGAPPLVWGSARANDVPVVADARTAARTAAEEEHRRLLYVAMTRAADRLIVCGARGEHKPPQGCWYRLVADALTADAKQIAAEIDEGSVWRWQKSESALADAAAMASPPAAPAPIDTPDWLDQNLAAAAPSPRTVAPSAAVERASYARTPAIGAEIARQDAGLGLLRGRLIHRLLQSLPAVVPEHRTAAARRFLGRAGKPLADADIEAMIAEVFAVLDDRAFALLFAPGTRAEVPIVGRIIGADGVPVSVSGQIDRLAVTADAVLIGDFKTERLPPRRLQDVPLAYRTQLAHYRAVLSRLYPGRPVRAALIWTQTPQLMELPAPMLDAALAGHHGVSAA